jgi:ribosomal protein S18 acetylase RimI-like enzyme
MESYGRHYHENEYGYITWQQMDNSVVINTLYVKPEYRSSSKARELADYVVSQLDSDITSLLCEIDLRNKTSDIAYRAIAGYGFKEKELVGNYLILEKGL